MTNRIKTKSIHALTAISMTLGMLGCGAAPENDGEDVVGVSTQELALVSNNLWSPLWNGQTRIPVCFTNGSTTTRNRVRNTVENSWEAIGTGITGPFGPYGVNFTGWGTCPGNTTGTIPITFDAGGNGVTGLGSTIQRMDLTSTAPADTIMHEFGHALGFTHEFRRDDYATVDPSCTASSTDPSPAPDLAVTPVDTASIMNYRSCGRAGNLTFGDIVGFAGLYGPWTLSYGETIAIRHDPSGRFVRGDSTPDASPWTIRANREFTLVNVASPGSTGQVNFGDSVRIRTNAGTFLRFNGRGARVTTTTSPSRATTWRVFGRTVSGPVRVNDQVLFASGSGTTGGYLQIDSSRRLTAESGDFFRLLHLLAAINM